MLKEDCFAWHKELQQCVALKETYCKSGECAFYRSAKERCKSCMAQANKIVSCKDNIANRVCIKHV